MQYSESVEYGFRPSQFHYLLTKAENEEQLNALLAEAPNRDAEPILYAVCPTPLSGAHMHYVIFRQFAFDADMIEKSLQAPTAIATLVKINESLQELKVLLGQRGAEGGSDVS